MKKTLQVKRVLRTALIVLLLGMAKTYAQTTFTVGDLNYSVNEDGVSVTVTGHIDGTEATGELVIPETVSYNASSYSVTSIGEEAFIFCSGFTGTLTLPNSLTSIGDYAFSYCSGFTGTLTLPNSLTSIGDHAFEYCSGFTGTLTLPNSLTSIGDWAFYDCSGFTGSLTLPNSLTSIGFGAFMGCSNFTGSLTLPNSLNSIGEGAFNGCSGFTGSLTLPNSLTSIGDGAFLGCSGFTGSLTLPNSLTSIGDGAFYDCSGFTGLLTLSNSLTSIGACAFCYCLGFTGSLTLPNSLTSIGFGAFCGCSSINSVISLATTPPLLGTEGYVFEGVPCNTLTVPCGCVSVYETSSWHDYFSTIVEDCTMVVDYMEKSIGVYPNPTSGIIHIEAENLRRISVLNSLGQQVYDKPIDGNLFEYDLSQYETGVYFIRMETATGVATKRVVLTK